MDTESPSDALASASPEHVARVLGAIEQEAATMGHGGMDVSPHEFKPLRRFRNRGRCATCLCHEEIHPALGWLPARPMFNTEEAIRVDV